MSEGRFDWNAMGDPIEIVRADNGMFVVNGHHRFVAARLAGVEIPESAIAYIDVPGEWIPGVQGWEDVVWSQ